MGRTVQLLGNSSAKLITDIAGNMFSSTVVAAVLTSFFFAAEWRIPSSFDSSSSSRVDSGSGQVVTTNDDLQELLALNLLG